MAVVTVRRLYRPVLGLWHSLACISRASHSETGGGGERESSFGQEGGEGFGQGKEKEIQVATSSLRVDTIAAAGLDISRKNIWESFLDGNVMVNGEPPKKKSVNIQEGDVIEVDTVLKPKGESSDGDLEDEGSVVRRGRVVVKEIGPRTRKGGYRLTLIRIKHFSLFKRNFSIISLWND